MARQRLTLITAGDAHATPGMAIYLAGVGKVHLESVEDVPEPPTVQEFRVQVTSPPDLAPFLKSHLESALLNGPNPRRVLTVTEVTP